MGEAPLVTATQPGAEGPAWPPADAVASCGWPRASTAGTRCHCGPCGPLRGRDMSLSQPPTRPRSSESHPAAAGGDAACREAVAPGSSEGPREEGGGHVTCLKGASCLLRAHACRLARLGRLWPDTCTTSGLQTPSSTRACAGHAWPWHRKAALDVRRQQDVENEERGPQATRGC